MTVLLVSSVLVDFHLLGLTGRFVMIEKQLLFLTHQFYLNVIIFLAALIGHKDLLIVSVRVCVCGCLSNILIVANSGGSCQAVFVNTTSSSSHCACLENMALFFCCKSRRLQISINVLETEACTSVCIFSSWHGGVHFCSEGELWVPSASTPSTQQRLADPVPAWLCNCGLGQLLLCRCSLGGVWGYTHSWASSSPPVPRLESGQVGQLQIGNVCAGGTCYAWLVLL